MDKDFLEFLQIVLIFVMIISLAIVAHNIVAAFGVLKSWYVFLVSAGAYYFLEEKING